jgi:RNA polymerase sigma factor (sigma-70 family)
MPLSWDAFLARYGPMARLIARSLVQPPSTAEDVVQEALLALHQAEERQPERFEEPTVARNYFLRAVHNLARKSRRDARPTLSLDEALAGSDPSAPAAWEERARQEELARCLRELPGAERELIVRRFFEGHTLQRIASERGVALSTLHDREKALLATLRRRLERFEGRGEEARR